MEATAALVLCLDKLDLSLGQLKTQTFNELVFLEKKF